VTGEVLDLEHVAAVLDRSDERAAWLRRVLAAEIRGYDRGRADGYAAGRRDESAERDAAWDAIARPAARPGPSYTVLEERRWGPGGREGFARQRPGDRPVRPRPAMRVWLGGPPVHHHACTAACRAYRPGPYSPADAAAILTTLPGDYAAEIASLQARARRERVAS
jgi:hypothetical protein